MTNRYGDEIGNKTVTLEQLHDMNLIELESFVGTYRAELSKQGYDQYAEPGGKEERAFENLTSAIYDLMGLDARPDTPDRNFWDMPDKYQKVLENCVKIALEKK
ncbi:MAG: hypothetical protein LBP62_03710 [Clostridiales bacterium]|jgi:hypothetical protein|nr:hypothetical protein [Clostridiales bacterium]